MLISLFPCYTVGCERVKFVFSPVAQHRSFHLAEGGVKVDCVEREFT